MATSSIFLATAVLPGYVYHFHVQGTTVKCDGLSDPREIKKSCGGYGYL